VTSAPGFSTVTNLGAWSKVPYAGDLTPKEAWALLGSDDGAVLVDVRTKAEWSYVGVPELADLGKHAVLIEWTTFPDGRRNADFVDQLGEAGADPASPVIFLCRSGQRSIGAAEAATAAGFARAYNVLEGFEGPLDDQRHRGTGAGWKASGLPWRQS
jgi:rhodanese-related sulfurtransferase